MGPGPSGETREGVSHDDVLYVTLILDPSDASDGSRHPRRVARPCAMLCQARKVAILPSSQIGEGPWWPCLGLDRPGWRRGRQYLPRPLGPLALHLLLPVDRLPEPFGKGVTGRIQ